MSRHSDVYCRNSSSSQVLAQAQVPAAPMTTIPLKAAPAAARASLRADAGAVLAAEDMSMGMSTAGTADLAPTKLNMQLCVQADVPAALSSAQMFAEADSATNSSSNHASATAEKPSTQCFVPAAHMSSTKQTSYKADLTAFTASPQAHADAASAEGSSVHAAADADSAAAEPSTQGPVPANSLAALSSERISSTADLAADLAAFKASIQAAGSAAVTPSTQTSTQAGSPAALSSSQSVTADPILPRAGIQMSAGADPAAARPSTQTAVAIASGMQVVGNNGSVADKATVARDEDQAAQVMDDANQRCQAQQGGSQQASPGSTCAGVHRVHSSARTPLLLAFCKQALPR